ncbi:hypothetical protein ACIPUB_06640 [Paeniglutamicibacter sp. ORCA_105]
MTPGFDTSAFREQPSPEEISAQAQSGRAWLRTAPKSIVIGLATACLVVWLVCSMGIAEAMVDSFNLDASYLNIGSGIFLGGVLAAAIGFLLQTRDEDPQVIAAQLARFVQRNGLSHNEEPKLPKLQGTIFEQGYHPRSWRRFRNSPAHPFPFEIAHYSYQTGSQVRDHDERPSVTSWTYVALTADRTLPRILLDAKANDNWFASSVPASMAKSQLLSLDGEHGSDFKVYAPEGYEQEAQRIFAPEVLERLKRDAPEFDVETVDDQIIFFARKELDLGRAQTWEQLSDLVFGVGATMVGLADSQPADRFGKNASREVTPAGSTLRKRRITPALLWTVGAVAILVLARLLFTGPLEGML